MSAQPTPIVAESAAPPDFDALASVYRWMEWLSFGPWLGWCRGAFLGRLVDRRRALILGDGDGRFAARLLAANRDVEVEALDASSVMLHALKRRAGANRDRLRTRVADARLWQPRPSERFDLVVTHYFLDCLTTGEIRQLAGGIRAALSPEALWVVSEFAIPPTRFGRLVARPLVGTLYTAFGWLTGLKVRRLPDHRSALRAAGFRLLEENARLRGLLVSELWMLSVQQSSSAYW